MKVFPTSLVRELDAYTIQHEPIASIDLMERAAAAMYDWVSGNISRQRKIVVFAGTGNNGGDALALARMLLEAGYSVDVYHARFSDRLSGDCTVNFERLKNMADTRLNILHPGDSLPEVPDGAVVIEGLFGSGLNRPLEGFAAEVVQHINKSRAKIISIDIPSGLFGEDNRNNNRELIIRADITLTLQFPKRSFFFYENDMFVGTWYIIPIGIHPEAIATTETDWFYTTVNDVRRLIRSRGKFSHKGTYGHALLVAGCYGRMGAAVLASRACLRTGVGLLTAHVPRYGNDILQTAVPEAMISLDQSDILVSDIPDLSPYSAIGAGPAMGCRQNSQKALHTLMERSSVPLVLDADAINILAAHPDWFEMLPENTILTPHPKEFDRLAGVSESGWERLEKAIRFSSEYKVIVVLKGAHSAVITSDGRVRFNSTGNPGMATGGSGDVLTGIILSLLAQRYDPVDAAVIGVFVHGLAGDLALEESAPEAVIASDITGHLGKAFQQLHRIDDYEEI